MSVPYLPNLLFLSEFVLTTMLQTDRAPFRFLRIEYGMSSRRLQADRYCTLRKANSYHKQPRPYSLFS